MKRGQIEPVLTAENLGLGYGEQVVVRHANFSVQAGDFVCVVGANGAGKSTLIKGILGLLKPAEGRVVYGDGLTQKQIGYLPQETKVDAHFPATVQEIVLSGALGRLGARPFYSATEKQLAIEKMRMVGLSALARESFADLSGGQKQKVLLARALMASDQLLVLDEPSNNLDRESRAELYAILRKLNVKGLTVMMITHDLDHGNLIGNKILALEEGEAWCGTTQEFVRRVHGEKPPKVADVLEEEQA